VISEINLSFIELVCEILGITTKLRSSSEFDFGGNKTESLLDICDQCSAEQYFSGPSAKTYFDMDLAKKAGVKVEWISYDNYPEYHRTHATVKFKHRVSVIDLLFNEGPNATKHMLTFNDSI